MSEGGARQKPKQDRVWQALPTSSSKMNKVCKSAPEATRAAARHRKWNGGFRLAAVQITKPFDQSKLLGWQTWQNSTLGFETAFA